MQLQSTLALAGLVVLGGAAVATFAVTSSMIESGEVDPLATVEQSIAAPPMPRRQAADPYELAQRAARLNDHVSDLLRAHKVEGTNSVPPAYHDAEQARHLTLVAWKNIDLLLNDKCSGKINKLPACEKLSVPEWVVETPMPAYQDDFALAMDAAPEIGNGEQTEEGVLPAAFLPAVNPQIDYSEQELFQLEDRLEALQGELEILKLNSKTG